jgi:ABC-type glutathione transport system ATPase component
VTPPPQSPIANRQSAIPEPLLSVENLSVALSVGGALRPAVDDVSFTLAAGEAVAVVGESGCGKTQLARAILGLSPENGRVGGRVVYGGRDLLSLSDREWRKVRGRHIGFVFQEPASALDPVQTIGAQIRESLRFHEDHSRTSLLNTSPSPRDAK